MTRASLKRLLIGLALGVVIAGGLAPFLPLPFLRPGIEQALAKRLGRRVEIGEVSLSLFGGPGFSVSGVTIHEDPRAGIEPFVYAPSVDARVDLLGLLAGRRGFSSLRFSDATLNLVRTRAGEWNFQYLLNPRMSGVPSIHLRGTRVNLKYAQTKSVLYFNDADVDLTPGDQGSLDLRFAGAPARTDRPAQSFGQVEVRGAWIPTSPDRPLNLRVELEPSSLDGLAKLFGRSWFDLQGQVALNAQLSGKPGDMVVTGEVQLDEGRRSDFLPSRDGKWNLAYRGKLDFLAEKLEVTSTSTSTAAAPQGAADGTAPVFARLEASDLLTSPKWKASVELNDAPIAVVADAARRIGAPLPAKLSAEGKLSGELNFDADAGLSGNLEARDAAVVLSDAADAPAVRSASVPIAMNAQTVSFGPATVTVGQKTASEKKEEASGEGRTAQVEASYSFDGSAAAEFKITTRALDLDDLRAFASVPLLEQAVADSNVRDRAGKGFWQGSLRYQSSSTDEGGWSGDYVVENARFPVDGIADPVRILSASVSAGPGRLSVTKIRAKVGNVGFSGEYHLGQQSASKPGKADAASVASISRKPADATETSANNLAQKFKFQIGELSVAELDRLFKPTLVRGGGFIERTLRLGSTSPAPDWMGQRKIEGTLSIAGLIAGDRKFEIDSARVVWDGASLRISGISGKLLDATGEVVLNPPEAALNPSSVTSLSSNKPPVSGELSVDLTKAAPQYRFTGKIAGVPYKGGRLDFEGRVDAAGEGLPFLASLHATGTLNGRSIAFSPEVDFRSVSGHFQAQMQGTSLAWKFSDLEVMEGADLYVGEGTLGADGKIVLDLSNRGR